MAVPKFEAHGRGAHLRWPPRNRPMEAVTWRCVTHARSDAADQLLVELFTHNP